MRWKFSSSWVNLNPKNVWLATVLTVFFPFCRNKRNIDNKENDSPLPSYKRDLVQKMKILKQELQVLQPQAGHCRLEVSREEIFEVRFQSV